MSVTGDNRIGTLLFPQQWEMLKALPLEDDELAPVAGAPEAPPRPDASAPGA